MEHAKILYQQLKELADILIASGRFLDSEVSIFDHKFFGPKAEDDLQNWCGGTGVMLAVDYKGDLYPCLRYMESSLGDDQPPMIIGNINTGILATKAQCDIADCLNCIDRRTQSTDECFNCPIADGCAWCSAYNYQVFGTPDKRATFICCMHKARALANAYYWNKVYRIADPNKRFKIYIPEEWALEIIDEKEWKLLKALESIN
jgi:radical SAM protein with 4Fe4S-binding SPASM domain